MPRIPESEELARLIQLYGAVEGRRRLAERLDDAEFTRPMRDKGVSMKNICKALAARRCPGLYSRRGY